MIFYQKQVTAARYHSFCSNHGYTECIINIVMLDY